jgi:hypothetical protein
MEPTSGDLRFTSHRLSDICLASEKGGSIRHLSTSPHGNGETSASHRNLSLHVLDLMATTAHMSIQHRT